MMFRALLSRVQADTEAFIDGAVDPRAYAGRATQRIGLLLNELHGHHRIEDLHYFPRLQGLDPRLAAGFDLLDADHHALDGHIHALADSTDTMLRGLETGTGAARAAAFRSDLTGLSRMLDRHLTDEEDLVVPVILHFAADL